MKSNITHTYIHIYHSVGPLQVWQRRQETDRSVIPFVVVVWCRVLHSRIVSVFNAVLSQDLNIFNVRYRFFVPCVQTLLKILWFFYWYSVTYIIKSANTVVHEEILFLNCWTMCPHSLSVWDPSPTLLLKDSFHTQSCYGVNHLFYMGIIFYHKFLCVMTNHWILLIFTFKSQLFLCLLNCT